MSPSPSSKKIIGNILFLFIFIFLAANARAASPGVNLTSPSDLEILKTSDVSFAFNVTADKYVRNASLYHNVSGSFAFNRTQWYGEFQVDADTLHLCHFNDNFVCSDGVDKKGLGTSPTFDAGKFYNGTYVGSVYTLIYDTPGNFNYSQGTVEIWFKPGVDVNSLTDHYIFAAGKSSGLDYEAQNRYLIYINSGMLYFSIVDQYGSHHYIEYDATSWNIGELHQVAALWDLDAPVGAPVADSRTDLYVDGNNTLNTYQSTSVDISVATEPDMMTIGSRLTKGRINSTMDELRISNTIRTAAEINLSYSAQISNYTEDSWTLNNIPDGTYFYNFLVYDNESQSGWGTSNYTFYIDTYTFPSVGNISVSPGSADDIDPNTTVTIEANVSDISGTSTVVLQYKDCPGCELNNQTMVNMSLGPNGRYNSSFTTSTSERPAYYYRFWSNDTNGISGATGWYNFSSEWDYSWNAAPSDMGTTSCPIDQTTYLGTFTVNNTGDDVLNFDLSDNWPLDVTYNISEPFSVEAKNWTAVNVSVRCAPQDSENVIIITVNASSPSEETPSPLYEEVSATLQSYTGGPYFVVDITGYPVGISQNMTVNLASRLKNIGNETGTQTWFNWTLPSGWDIVTGNLSMNVSNITSGETTWNNLTVNLNSSFASAGVSFIYANASCAESTNDSDSKMIQVNCNDTDGVCGAGCTYLTDNNCQRSSTEGGGTRTAYVSSATRTYGIILSVPRVVDARRGETKTFMANVSNPKENSTVYNVSLSVAGYSPTHINVTPATFDDIMPGQNRQFMIEIIVPSYKEHEEHLLNITVNADTGATGNSTEKRLMESKETRLIINTMDREDANETINRAILAIGEMDNAGWGAGKASELLEQAKKALEELNYDEAGSIANNINNIKEAAFRTQELIAEIESKISGHASRTGKFFGVQRSFSETVNLINLAKAAFEREDYITALKRVKDAELVFSSESGSFEPLLLLVNNLWTILFFIVILSIGGFFGRLMYLKSTISRKIIDLGNESDNIRKLMGQTQTKYLKEKSLGEGTFHRTMSQYQKRLSKIKRSVTRLRYKRRKLIGFENIMKALEDEKKDIMHGINNLQREYFRDNKFSKGYYNDEMMSHAERLAEIENDKLVAELKSPKGRWLKWINGI